MNEAKDAEPEYEVPPEQAGHPPEPESPPPAGPAPMMSASPSGLRIGDFVVRPTVVTSTDDTRDNPQNVERARAREDDARAARFGGDGGPAPAWSTGPRPVTPRSSLDDAIDAAREKATAEAAGAPGAEATELSILLRDPVTGEPIGTG